MFCKADIKCTLINNINIKNFYAINVVMSTLIIQFAEAWCWLGRNLSVLFNVDRFLVVHDFCYLLILKASLDQPQDISYSSNLTQETPKIVGWKRQPDTPKKLRKFLKKDAKNCKTRFKLSISCYLNIFLAGFNWICCGNRFYIEKILLKFIVKFRERKIFYAMSRKISI